MGNMPNYRAIVKVGDKRWNSIGAGWAKADKISVQLEQTPVPNNGKMNFLLVPNKPRERKEAQEVAVEA